MQSVRPSGVASAVVRGDEGADAGKGAEAASEAAGSAAEAAEADKVADITEAAGVLAEAPLNTMSWSARTCWDSRCGSCWGSAGTPTTSSSQPWPQA